MATIALCHAPFASHIPLPSRLGVALQRRGHRVIAFTPSAQLKDVEALGLTARADGRCAAVWRTLAALGRPPGSAGAGLATLVALQEACADGFTDFVAELVAESPDAVISDVMASWGILAGRWLRLPLITSVVAHTLTPPRPDSGPTPHDEALLARLNAARTMTDGFWALAARRGAAPGPYGDRTVLYTSPELTGSLISHPSCRFIGPLADLAAAGNVDVDPLTRPLILLTPGTLMTDRAPLIRAAIEGLDGEPVDLLIATGERFAVSDLGSLPANVAAVARVDQPAVLRRAALFITHAGLNSVLEALLAGVPMLCAPGAGDQRAGARRVADLGAGALLDEQTPAAVRAGVRRLLDDPGPRARARELGAGLRASGGTECAAAIVEELIR